jgi:hypothetical protein
MRQVQVRGCLPAVLMLLLLGALLALVITASAAVVLPVAGALLVLGLARSLWYRLTGRLPPTPWRVTTVRGARFEEGWVGGAPQGPAGDEGPVVDALPRTPPARDQDGARAGAPEPGRLPGPSGTEGGAG